MFYGVALTDEPYQAMNAIDWRHSPATFMSGAIVSLWGNAVGWNVLSLRVFAISVLSVSCALTGLYMYRRTRNAGVSMALTGIAIALSAQKDELVVYSWNCLSTASFIVALLLLLHILRRPAIWKMAAYGLVAAFIATLRFPNVMIVPAVILIQVIDGFIGHRWRFVAMMACAFTVTFVSVWLLSVSIVFGSPAGFFDMLADTLVTNHAPAWLVLKIILTSIDCIARTSVLVLGAAMIYFAGRWFGMRGAVWAGVIYGAYLFIYLYMTRYDGYAFFINHQALGLLVLGIIYVLLRRRGEPFGRDQVALCAMLVFSALPMLGSNVGIPKMISYQFYPLIGAFALPLIASRARLFCIVTLGVYLAFVPVRKWCSNFEDEGVASATVILDQPRLKGIRTCPERAATIAALYDVSKSMAAGEVLFESQGPIRFMGYYLNESTPPYDANEWTPSGLLDHPGHMAKCLSRVDGRAGSLAVAVLCPDPDADVSGLERELLLRGAAVSHRRGMRIYCFGAPYKPYTDIPGPRGPGMSQ